MPEGQGYFEFGTNIEQVRQQIQTNLQAIQEAVSRPMSAGGANPFERFSFEAQRSMDQILTRVGELSAKIRESLSTGGASQGQFLPQASGVLTRQLEDLRRSGAAMVAENPELAKPITDSLRMLATQLREAIAQVASEISGEAKGLGYGPRKVVGTGLTQLDAQLANLSRPFGTNEVQAATLRADAAASTTKSVDQNLTNLSRSADAAASRIAKLQEMIASLGENATPAQTMRVVETWARGENQAYNIEAKSAEMQANQARLQSFFSQMESGQGNAFATRNFKYGLSSETGLIDLGSGRVITEEREIRVALQQLINELRNVQLQGENTRKTLGDAFGEGFFGIGGSKYRGNAGQAVNPLLGFAETAGIVAKYALQAEVLFKLQSELHSVAENYAQLSEAQEQLGSIMGEGTHISDDYINSLQNLSVVAGESVVQALRAAQIGVAAFSNESQTTAQRLQTGATFNSAAVQLGQISGAPLMQAAESEVAIGTSFGLQAQDLPRVANAVAVAFEKFGANRAETTEGLRQIAQAGQAAGYSLEQLAQVVGLVQARTAEGGTTIAQSLGRIFSLVQGQQGQSLLAGLGVDTGQSIATQLDQLGQRWSTLSQKQQEAVLTTLGGERSLKELAPLLSQNVALQEAFKLSVTDTSAAQRQQDAIINSVVGQLRIFAQTLKNIGQDIARSGIATPFGILLKSLQPVLDLTDRLLQQWDALPGVFKGVTASILELVAVFKLAQTGVGQAALGSVVGGIRGIFRRGGGVAAAEGEGAGVAVADVLNLFRTGKTKEALAELEKALKGTTEAAIADKVATEADTAAKRVDAATTGVGDVEGGAGLLAKGGRFGRFLPAGIGGGLAVAGAAAALVTIAGTADSWLHLSQTASKADAYLQEVNNLQGTNQDIVGSLQAASIGLNDTATKLRDQSSGPFGALANFLSGHHFTNEAAQLQRTASHYSALEQRIINEQQSANTSSGAANEFFNGTTNIADSLKQMTDRGFTASQQIRALASAVGLLGDSSKASIHNILASGGQAPGLQGTSANLLLGADAGLAGALHQVRLAIHTPGEIGKLIQEITDKELADYNANQQVAEDAAFRQQYPHGTAHDRELFNRQFEANQGPPLIEDPTTQAYKVLSGMEKFRDKLLGKDGGFDVTTLVTAMSSKLEELGKFANGKILSPADQKQLAQVAANALGPQLNDLPESVREAVINGVIKSVTDKFAELGAGTGPKVATSADLSTFLNGDPKKKTSGFLGLIQAFQPTAFDQTGGAFDLGLLAAEANKAIADARAAGLDQTDTGDFNTLLTAAQDATAKAIQARVTNLENMRKALDSRTSNANVVFRNDLKAHLQEVRTVLNNPVDGEYDVKDLSAIISTMSESEANKIKAILQTAVDNTRHTLAAALRALANLDAEIASIMELPGGIINTDPTAAAARNDAIRQHQAAQDQVDKAQAAADAASKQLKAFANALSNSATTTTAGGDNFDPAQVAEAKARAQATPGDPVSQARADLAAANIALSHAKQGSVEWWDAYKQVQDAKYQLSQAELDVSRSAIEASIIPGDRMSEAHAAMREAKIALDKDKNNQAAFNADLKALHEAEYELAEATREFQNNKELLRIDLTDPVAVAKAAVDDARRKLREDRKRGAGKDVIAADQVALERAQADAQKQGFDQRLNDEKTLFDLHEISGQAYIAFLNKQDQSLRSQLATKKKGSEKYRQLLDELNEVDKAILDYNNSAAGQFNLGDIKVPTPYEARREVAALSAGVSYQGVTNNNVNVTINGDPQLFKAILDQYFGSKTTQRSSTTPRKV